MTRWALQVVRGCDFDATIKAADDGDQEARVFMLAFAEWDRAVRESEAEPGCFSCHAVVTPQNFGGLGFAREIEAQTGLTGAFCLSCQRKGFHTLADEFSEQLAEGLELEMVSLH
jgi:nitrate/TMAO reductase-like tetraheme cytochrome c subunit